jgi:hypothetical protein
VTRYVSSGAGLRKDNARQDIGAAGAIVKTSQTASTTTISAVLVEGKDTFAATIKTGPNVNITLTEAKDAFSGAISSNQTIALALTEAKDAFTGTLVVTDQVNAAMTESPDQMLVRLSAVDNSADTHDGDPASRRFWERAQAAAQAAREPPRRSAATTLPASLTEAVSGPSPAEFDALDLADLEDLLELL